MRVPNAVAERLWVGVLSIGKLAAGQHEYYLAAVAKGAEEYYTAHGEEPGRWMGGGAADLGLSGVVAADDLRAVLKGVDPRDADVALGQRRDGRVPGFDVTLSAPKSVSLLYGLGEGSVPRQVVAAHDAAVAAAVAYLEREAAVVRRGTDGARRLGSSGFVGAAFRHRTSRAGDPQLHTHLLIANAARATDDRWSALDARLLYLQQRTAGFLYQAQLRAELTRRLGVSWSAPRNGMAEIAGVPAAVLRAFSQRRLEIEQRLAKTGGSSARAAEVATLATRRAKDHDVDADSLFTEWRARAAAIGFGPEQVRGLLGRRREPSTPAVAREQMGALLTEHRSWFDRCDTLRFLAEQAVEGADVAVIEADGAAFLNSPTPVALTADRCGMRYSTRQLLDIEATVIDDAQRARRAGLAVAEEAAVVAALAARPTLSDEQRTLVRTVTRSGSGVDVVVGAAGSGKTFALDAARAAWHASGTRVVGVALAARAAVELQAGSGIPSFTIDALLHHASDHRGPALALGSVLVVDEAGMVGTRKLARLLALANKSAAKVVLVGDPRQLPEVQAGGTYSALVARLGATTLTANQRQRDPIERLVLAQLRRRRVKDAVGLLAEHGHVTEAATAPQARDALVADWAAARAAGRNAVMLAVRRADVEDLNRRARDTLAEAHQLGATELVAGNQRFASGDHILALKNKPRLGLLNGTLGVVTAANPDLTLTVTRDHDQASVVIPADYIAAGHVTHAYARTIHKAQGMTCDDAFLLGDDRLYLEAGYTALSRGRHANRAYVVAEHADGCECDTDQRSGTDLVDTLTRSAAQQTATELQHDRSAVRQHELGISR